MSYVQSQESLRYPGSTGLQGASFEPSYVRYEHAHEPAAYRSGGGFSNVQGFGGMITLPQSRTMHAMERAPVMVRPYSAAPLLPGSARMPILRPQSAVPIDYAYHRGKALELYGDEDEEMMKHVLPYADGDRLDATKAYLQNPFTAPSKITGRTAYTPHTTAQSAKIAPGTLQLHKVPMSPRRYASRMLPPPTGPLYGTAAPVFGTSAPTIFGTAPPSFFGSAAPQPFVYGSPPLMQPSLAPIRTNHNSPAYLGRSRVMVKQYDGSNRPMRPHEYYYYGPKDDVPEEVKVKIGRWSRAEEDKV